MSDVVRMVVDLPPGSGPGPMVTPTLGAWGARSAPAYHALLNLAYRWFEEPTCLPCPSCQRFDSLCA